MLYYEMLKVQIIAIAVDSGWMTCWCCAGKGSEQGKGPGQKGEPSQWDTWLVAVPVLNLLEQPPAVRKELSWCN